LVERNAALSLDEPDRKTSRRQQLLLLILHDVNSIKGGKPPTKPITTSPQLIGPESGVSRTRRRERSKGYR
jgi:hypothetical protein